MKRWKVLINGTNFKIPCEDPKSRQKGFYKLTFHKNIRRSSKIKRRDSTMVFVTAHSSKEAELKAVNILRADK
jgi:hypothetical protein